MITAPYPVKTIEVYGHRGARSFSPENTLPAYSTALALGCTWVDLDIVITRDGVIVLHHDLWLNPDILSKNGQFWATSRHEFYQQLQRAPGGITQNIQPYLIKNLTLAQLEEYDAGMLNPASPYASYFPAQQPQPGTRIPTLQAVIDYVNQVSSEQVNFQIEIKTQPEYPEWSLAAAELAAGLDKFLRYNNLQGRVEIQAFEWQVLLELQKINPQLKTAYLIDAAGIAALKSQPGGAGLANTTSRDGILQQYNNSIPRLIKALGGACYEPEDTALTKEDLDEAQRLGLKVVVWGWPERSGTAFDPKLMAKLIAWGVDGIITDDPAQLNGMLAARGVSLPPRYGGTI